MAFLHRRILLSLILAFISSVSFAQRYGIGSDEGARGLKIFGGILLGVALITVALYIRQRMRK